MYSKLLFCKWNETVWDVMSSVNNHLCAGHATLSLIIFL